MTLERNFCCLWCYFADLCTQEVDFLCGCL